MPGIKQETADFFQHWTALSRFLQGEPLPNVDESLGEFAVEHYHPCVDKFLVVNKAGSNSVSAFLNFLENERMSFLRRSAAGLLRSALI